MKILDLGKTEYTETLRLQKKLFEKKINQPDSPDIVIITEHFPVFTLGKTTQKEHITDIPKNIPVVPVERGGSITFHGPGQLVVYPIINLRKSSVKNFVWTLEQIMIDTLEEFSIEGFRNERYRGVFTQKGKIGFVGVKISRMVSYHGFSLNVDVDKTFFEKVIPCGIYDIPVCNLSDFLNEVSFDEVKNIIIKNIRLRFTE